MTEKVSMDFGHDIPIARTSEAVSNHPRPLASMPEDLLSQDRSLFFDMPQDLLCVADFEGMFLQVNPAWEKQLGWKIQELTSRAWIEFVHPDDVEAAIREFVQLLDGKPTIGYENRFRCKDGSFRWFSWNAYPSLESNRIFSVVRDITDAKRERLRAESYNATLSLLASGAALETVLESIVRGAEAEHPGMICTIMLLDREGLRLTLGAAPSLPTYFNDAVDRVKIGPNVGSCGSATFFNRRVIVEDIEKDPKWTDFLVLTRSVGLRSCWSQPICSSSGEVLGVFGNYRKQVALPSEYEIQTVVESAKFAGLAIERQRSQESMILARTTIDKVALAVYWIKPDSRFVDVNETACNELQYSRDELIGMSVGDVDPNYTLERWKPHWEDLREKRKLTFVSRHRRKDGTEFDVEIKAHYIQFGNDELNFAFVQDITDRIRSEAALRKSHKQYQSIVETATEGVWMVDTHGTTTFVNARLSELLGLGADEIVGRSFASFVDVPCQQAVGQVLSLDHSRINRSYDFRFLRDDQTELWAIVSSTPLRNERHMITGWLIMVTDITDRKRMEEKLVVAQQRAEDANRIKSEFIANMSHEIRTPMTAILGYADLLSDEDTKLLSKEQRLQYFETIKRNGKHLLTIIDDVLDIAKIEAGKLDVERIKTDPVQVLFDVLDLMQVKAEAKGLRLQASFDSALPVAIQSDPVRLRQILMNLVGNAIKFTERGHVHVGLHCNVLPESEFRFIVSDSGIGLSNETMDRLFGSFEQADASTKRRFGGSGLGLRISQSLASMLGGSISVDSCLGKGSTFTASIATGPLDDVPMISIQDNLTRIANTHGDLTATENRATSRLGSRQTLRGMRILLAEDGIDNQRLIAFFLRKAGASVTIVENGKLAMQAMRLDSAAHGIGPIHSESTRREHLPCEFDLIVTDIQMPEMDGLELTRTIRSMGFDVPVLALTAHAMNADAEKCIEVGCNLHLSKPIDRERLIAACEQWARPSSVRSGMS